MNTYTPENPPSQKQLLLVFSEANQNFQFECMLIFLAELKTWTFQSNKGVSTVQYVRWFCFETSTRGDSWDDRSYLGISHDCGKHSHGTS